MNELKPPPLPGKPLLIATAAGVALLLGVLTVLLYIDFAPERELTPAQEQAREQQAEANEEFRHKQEQRGEDISEHVQNGHYARQLQHREEGATDERQYLAMRDWGTWHIIIPLFIVVLIFLWWVKTRHSKWIK